MKEKDTANIGKPERVPLTELNLHHKNPRRGDVDAIMGSMVANGVYNPLTVNRGTYTGRPNEVLAGNHRLKAMRRLAEEHPDDPRWQTVDVWVVDVDEERATKILLSDNRTSDLGSYDEEELLGLLDTVDYDLDGTGYDYDDLEGLADTPNEEEKPKNEKYVQDITIPQYEPQSSTPPPPNECVNTEKLDKLIQEINSTEMPDDMRRFLTIAAYRHAVIDFRNAAELYAHQPAEIQELMENNALVIIDPNNAIREGFMRLGSNLHDLFNTELENAEQ